MSNDLDMFALGVGVGCVLTWVTAIFAIWLYKQEVEHDKIK